jgi:hypothetical protein
MALRNWDAVNPFAVGTSIVSLDGECDQNDDGSWNFTGPDAVGIIQALVGLGRGEHNYQVTFEPSGCAVHLYHSEIEDSRLYRVLS